MTEPQDRPPETPPPPVLPSPLPFDPEYVHGYLEETLLELTGNADPEVQKCMAWLASAAPADKSWVDANVTGNRGADVPAVHTLMTPCKHCHAKQGEQHSVTCPYGVALPVVGPSGADWIAVGGFRFDRHAGWQQVAKEYESEPDVTTLCRKAGVRAYVEVLDKSAQLVEEADWNRHMREKMDAARRHDAEQNKPSLGVAASDCLHDETERLGAIWTRCNQCGRRWADDDPKNPFSTFGVSASDGKTL